MGQNLSNRRKVEAEDGPLHLYCKEVGCFICRRYTRCAEPYQCLRKTGLRNLEKHRGRSVKKPSFLAYFLIMSVQRPQASGPPLHLERPPLRYTCSPAWLARLWSAPEAIFLWTELVNTRRERPPRKVSSDKFHFFDLTTARMEVTREQLAAWDNSAR